jgi:hypothetical protein
MKKTEEQNKRSLYIVTTRTVAATLQPEEIQEALIQLKEKMKVQDPLNPDLWTVFIGGHKLWGILDRRAGPNGEDLLTILFPEDY